MGQAAKTTQKETGGMIETALLILRLCGPNHEAIAPHVDRAAHRWHVPPAVLVAMARRESTCDPDAVGGKDGINVGLLQIRVGGSAARSHTADELKRPRLNLELGARHLRRWLDTCGDIRAALGVFNGWKKCSLGRRSPYARDVLNLAAQASHDGES